MQNKLNISEAWETISSQSFYHVHEQSCLFVVCYIQIVPEFGSVTAIVHYKITNW